MAGWDELLLALLAITIGALGYGFLRGHSWQEVLIVSWTASDGTHCTRGHDGQASTERWPNFTHALLTLAYFQQGKSRRRASVLQGAADPELVAARQLEPELRETDAFGDTRREHVGQAGVVCVRQA